MVKLKVEEAKEIPVLPDDSILHLRITETETREVQGQRGPWEKLEITFKVLGVQHVPGSTPDEFDNMIGEKIWGSCSLRLTDNPENKLRLWAEAILNMPCPVGFELDTDYFLGRDVRGVTSTYEKRNKINPATGQPFKGHQIKSLLPMGGGLTQAPQAAQAAPQQQPNSWGQSPQPSQDPWVAQTGTQAYNEEPPF